MDSKRRSMYHRKRKGMKYFIGSIDITNGEYEYEYPRIIEAPDYKSACKAMRAEAQEFYGGDCDEDDPDTFYFHGGQVAVSYDVSSEVTKAEWFAYHMSRFLVKWNRNADYNKCLESSLHFFDDKKLAQEVNLTKEEIKLFEQQEYAILRANGLKNINGSFSSIIIYDVDSADDRLLLKMKCGVQDGCQNTVDTWEYAFNRETQKFEEE